MDKNFLCYAVHAASEFLEEQAPYEQSLILNFLKFLNNNEKTYVKKSLSEVSLRKVPVINPQELYT